MKKESPNQSRGNNGEMEFAAWISRAGIYSEAPKKDSGFDFLCQVPGNPVGKDGTFTMPGHFLAVSVRSTTDKQNFVLINRADVELFLTSCMPMALAMVQRTTTDKNPRISLRIVDENFIIELEGFLGRKQESRSIRFDTGIENPEIAANEIKKQFDPVYMQRLRLFRDELRLSRFLKSPSVRLSQTTERTLAMIHTEDFASQYDLSSPKASEGYRDAFFGLEMNMADRLKKIPFKAGLLEHLGKIGDRIVVHAPAFQAAEREMPLEVINGSQAVKQMFEFRTTDDWMAFCHPSGLSIRFSHKIKCQDGEHFHQVVIKFDAGVTFGDVWENEIGEFLANCDRNSILRLQPEDWEIPMSNIPQLSSHSIACNGLKRLREKGLIDLSTREVESITQSEFGTIQVLDAASQDFKFIERFGFALDSVAFEDMKKSHVSMEIPICGNLNGCGIILWILANGLLFKNLEDGVFCGLKIEKVLEHRVEIIETTFPVDDFPEMKLCSEFPGIPMDLTEEISFDSGKVDDWGVSFRIVDLKDTE